MKYVQRFVRQSNIIFLFQLGGNNVQFYCIRVSLCVHLGLCSVVHTHAKRHKSNDDMFHKYLFANVCVYVRDPLLREN